MPRTCTGNPTFDLSSTSAFSEWPTKIPGLICKTPPTGSLSAARFAQCCSGEVYNVTSPTTPDDAAYPMSCAAFCQIAPDFDARNDRYPYGWSDHFMCLTDGGEEASDWEVVCDTVTVKGTPAPDTYASTPTGPWVTRSYSDPFADTGASPTRWSESAEVTASSSGGGGGSGSGSSSSSGVETSSTDALETSVSTRSSVVAVSSSFAITSEDASTIASVTTSATTSSSTSGVGHLTVTTKHTGMLLLMAAWYSSSFIM